MTPNFKRVAEFVINPGPNARILKYPEFTLEFEKVFDFNGAPDETSIRIFNPSSDTLKAFNPLDNKTKVRMIINAGFEADFGLVAQGDILRRKTETIGNDRIFTAVVQDRNRLWQDTMVSKTFSGVQKASFIIDNIFSSFGIKATINLGNDITFEDKSINSTLRRFVEDMAKETNSKFFMSDARMIFQPKIGKQKRIVFLLSPDSGLIDRPEITDKGLKIKTLFNYRYRSNDTVKVEFNNNSDLNIDQTFKVLRGLHVFQDKDGFTELELGAA